MMKLRRIVASLLVVCMTGIGMPLPAHAGMISTDAVTHVAAASADRERIGSMLDRADVQAQLQSYGVSAAT